MFKRKQFIVFNVFLIVLIAIYLCITIVYNQSFKHSFEYFSPQEVINNQLIDKITTIQPIDSVLNESISNVTDLQKLYEIRKRVNTTDQYLKRLSQFTKKRINSRLIYPNEMLEMTSITINQRKCSEEFGRDLLLVILVFIRVDGFDRRQLIRETWGQDIKNDSRSRLFFATGLSRDPKIEKQLRQENNKFSDILQFGYYEDYYNCTIKATALLRWTAISCPFVKFMLKVDDDSLILSKNLLEFCDKTEPNSIFGYLWSNPQVLRGKDKWAISLEDFPQSFYPDYIGGPYLIPGRYIPYLYETAINKCLPALTFEDVYITGIVAEKTGVKRSRLSSLLFTYPGCPVLRLDYCYYKNYSIFWQGFSDYQLRTVWNIFKSGDVCPSKGDQRC